MVRRVLGAVTMMLALVLAACTGNSKADDPPTSAPPTSESPSPSESATPEKPEMPAAAKQPTEAGAIEFVRYYWAVVDYAGESRDLDSVRALSGPNCKSCKAGMDVYAKVHDGGGTVRGEPGSIEQAQASVSQLNVQGEPGTLAKVRHIAVRPPTVHDFGPDDPRNKQWNGGRYDFIFVLYWQPEKKSWLVTDWQVP